MREDEKKKEESLYVHEEITQQPWKIEEGERKKKCRGGHT